MKKEKKKKQLEQHPNIVQYNAIMNSKQRRQEDKRLLNNSQYSVLPVSSIDVSVETINKMGRDYRKHTARNDNNNDKSQQANKQNKTSASSNPFVIGLNAVTRALENEELQIVVVSGKAKKLYVQHIPMLCHNMNCQWSTKMDLSREDLGKIFGIKRVTIFGLRKTKMANDKVIKSKNVNNNVNNNNNMKRNNKRTRTDEMNEEQHMKKIRH